MIPLSARNTSSGAAASAARGRNRSGGVGGSFADDDAVGAAAGLLALDNPDQRLTADAAALTKSFAKVVHATLVVPFLVVFYTWYLVGMFGWIAPLACYLYFVVASTINWWVGLFAWGGVVFCVCGDGEFWGAERDQDGIKK